MTKEMTQSEWPKKRDGKLIDVSVNDQQSELNIDQERIVDAVQCVLRGEGIMEGSIGLAIVDDATIQDLNRRYLNHDYATDVLSFLLHRDGNQVEGDVIASAQTAARSAREFGWSAADELLLYVVHGTLHLAGYDDKSNTERSTMRGREEHYLLKYGLEPRYEDVVDANTKKGK